MLYMHIHLYAGYIRTLNRHTFVPQSSIALRAMSAVYKRRVNASKWIRGGGSQVGKTNIYVCTWGQQHVCVACARVKVISIILTV